MNILKINILSILTLAILASCSGEKEPDLASSAQDTKYVEYIFCDLGPDYTNEGFMAMIQEWNSLQDSLETPVEISAGLAPRTENDLYDFLWAIAWILKRLGIKPGQNG